MKPKLLEIPNTPISFTIITPIYINIPTITTTSFFFVKIACPYSYHHVK